MTVTNHENPITKNDPIKTNSKRPPEINSWPPETTRRWFRILKPSQIPPENVSGGRRFYEKNVTTFCGWSFQPCNHETTHALYHISFTYIKIYQTRMVWEKLVEISVSRPNWCFGILKLACHCFPRVFMIPLYACFLKWWYPTTMGFPTKNDHFGVIWGYHHLRKHPCRSNQIPKSSKTLNLGQLTYGSWSVWYRPFRRRFYLTSSQFIPGESWVAKVEASFFSKASWETLVTIWVFLAILQHCINGHCKNTGIVFGALRTQFASWGSKNFAYKRYIHSILRCISLVSKLWSLKNVESMESLSLDHKWPYQKLGCVSIPMFSAAKVTESC